MLSTAAASTVSEPVVVHASEPLSDVQWVGCECAAVWTFIVMLCVKLCFDVVFGFLIPNVSRELGYEKR